ncbi:hypothetical protein GCM10007320_54200 [Pseudorhodoferax aquiterrae]|uniref:histidine kinase n=2 Tax=Pseudorhodoferax aquiterrae TaxID=747304 RepID=A0ABQ3G970_9BURK|nr:hypothetical protein GCM10007320_54200 [Pseudorhodoferax aquiterrae]
MLVLAVWVPAAVGFGVFATFLYNKEVELALDKVERLANWVSTATERHVDQRVLLARTLASSSALQEKSLSKFHDEAAAAVDASNWVTLYSGRRVFVETPRPFAAQPMLSDVGLPTPGDRPTVVFSTLGNGTPKPVVSVLVAVAHSARPGMNVAVSFEPQAIQSLLNDSTLPLGGVIAVLDSEQTVVARSRDPEKWVGRKATGATLDRARAGKVGFEDSVTLDGVHSFTFVGPANAFGWTVVVGTPKAALASTATRVTTQAVAASAVLLLVSLALALFGAQGISSVVRALQRSAAALATGSVPERLRTGVREVDEVSVALHDAGATIQSANHELEGRVESAVAKYQAAQEKLVAAQRHEAIGRLTGGIAHDFNNLLQTISSAHQLLSRHVTESQPRKLLLGAVRATSKASDLVKHLLTFGRAQALQPTTVHLGDVLLSTQDLTSKAVGENIELTANLQPGLPALFVDPVQFELALLNLVFNARDAIADRGRITISARQADASETAHLDGNLFVRLEVADTGVGIPDDVKARVFEPYFTTKPLGQGSGLGLAQVDGFARQSGGDIQLHTQPGSGTTVALFLPISTVAAGPGKEQAPAAVSRTPLRVLMVEDDVLLSSVLVPALEDGLHQVTLCRTADEAVERLRDGAPFDVLFTDVVMPGSMNGMDLVKWVREHYPHLPALVATGYAERLSEVPVQVLRKPFDLEELMDALQQSVMASGATAT